MKNSFQGPRPTSIANKKEDLNQNYIKLGKYPQKTHKLSKEEEDMIIDILELKKNKQQLDEEEMDPKIIEFRSSMKFLPSRSSIRPNTPEDLDFARKTYLRTTRKSNNLANLRKLLDKDSKYNLEKRKLKIGENFKDKNFERNLDSIVGWIENYDPFYEKLGWLRAKDFQQIKRENGQLYVTGKKIEDIHVYRQIRPEDIIQGKLGDCYLLAACGSICQYPNRLERIFISGSEYKKNGLYAVAMCLNGIWEEVVLDDYFPSKLDICRPAFSYSKNNSLWMMLIEKAWAKVHMGYLNISCGFAREALRDLTGAPTMSYFFKDGPAVAYGYMSKRNKENWDILKEAFQKRFMICASTKNFNKGNDAVDKKTGLSGSHAYSVLEVIEVDWGNFLFIIYSISLLFKFTLINYLLHNINYYYKLE